MVYFSRIGMLYLKSAEINYILVQSNNGYPANCKRTDYRLLKVKLLYRLPSYVKSSNYFYCRTGNKKGYVVLNSFNIRGVYQHQTGPEVLQH